MDQPSPLETFHPPVRAWFEAVFEKPTLPQTLGWPAIARGDSTLILAPTGTGKTLTAFLACIDRLMFTPPPPAGERCRVLYLSPIKALAVDVDRNLRAPLVGISQMARKMGIEAHEPTIAIRTGDTPAADRARFLRRPADILITTPESLYLLLTSNSAESLRSIETVIIDEIHALVPVKRGTHLALSLERLQHLCARPLQRIGLSATQRPLEEVARFLGGCEPPAADAPMPESGEFGESEPASAPIRYRPVTIVDASAPKRLDLRVEMPLEEHMRNDGIRSGPASQGLTPPSIWSSIYPKLLELIRSHQSTLIFVNSRRLAERIAGAINELAEEVLVRAHHGSVAASQRKEIEESLKRGTLRGLVATSSLELGIDMGSIDLVVQVEAPPSVASGLQRIGRAAHHVGGTSEAVIFPKYRGDLVACAAISRAIQDGAVERVSYPRNPLDVLAQQLVAMIAMEPWTVDSLYRAVVCAAPYASLPRAVYEGVLDMLAGRYPSDEFAELRPRITWDRITGILTPRQGARRIAVVNGGAIPDRGLYGVFLAGAGKGARVGELDEEMVFESHAGQTIILGATTWRIEEITHDRVLVSPAPGEPGVMPFWRGDAAGRPAEFGRRIGEMTRGLLDAPRPLARATLAGEHALDENAAVQLLQYLEEQAEVTGRVPSDRDIVVERCRDELGDWRVCVLSPYGGRVHAPWCMAVCARLREERGLIVESMWTDDGFVIRLPDSEQELDASDVLPPSGDLRRLVLQQLSATSLFAAKFREAAGRALLLPRRTAGARAPLWRQRKRSADLLAVAARYPAFPILMETYRECLREVLDLPAAIEILRGIERGRIHVAALTTDKPSPYAATLLFSYVANYIYDGDAPLAERRAQALSIDQSQLEELLGGADLRELLDAAAIDAVEAQLQSLDPEYQVRHADGLHDLLLKLGDLTEEEIQLRSAAPVALEPLLSARRIVRVRIAGEARFIPVEYAGRYRDALGVPLPPGLADTFLEPTPGALEGLLRRYARTHGPFTAAEAAARYHLPEPEVALRLKAMQQEGKLLEGEFRPQGMHIEWCDPEVLRQIRRKSLARLRREVAPAEQHVFARFLTRWHGLSKPARSGPDALLDELKILQGASLIVSDLEREILPARLREYHSGDLDELLAAGEVVWAGREALGKRDGRIVFYLAESLPYLLPPGTGEAPDGLSERAARILAFLDREGASFESAIHLASGGGFPNETTEALWELTWAGLVTNDTFHPLRALLSRLEDEGRRKHYPNALPGAPDFLRQRARRRDAAPRGRWSLLRRRIPTPPSDTQWVAATAQQLLVRYGVVMRESAAADNVRGGYSALYPALRTMEESGWVRRGMFVDGMGAAQFATTAAVDLLRSLNRPPEEPEAVHLAAADPANPYGALLPWLPGGGDHSMARAAGASVVLVDGRLAAFLRRGAGAITVMLPESEPERDRTARALAQTLAAVALQRQSRRGGLLIETINGEPASAHLLSRYLLDSGFALAAGGFQMRREARREAQRDA